jgi:hypothetical protein
MQPEFLDELLTIQPWKPSTIIYLPMSFIEKTLDLDYINKIQREDTAWIDELQHDIAKNNLKLPGTLTISTMKIKLQDGNHRFIACERLGFQSFPVRTEYTDGHIRSGGLLIQDIIEGYLRAEKIY